MILLEERAPLLEEVQVSNRGNHNGHVLVKLSRNDTIVRHLEKLRLVPEDDREWTKLERAAFLQLMEEGGPQEIPLPQTPTLKPPQKGRSKKTLPSRNGELGQKKCPLPCFLLEKKSYYN